MRKGIVGHEGAKFTPVTERKARAIIRGLLNPGDVMVSGHCHLGGIDIWAEEEADSMGIEKQVFPPKRLEWEGGYKQRNIQIAESSDCVHVLVVAKLSTTYKGMRFPICYHCKTKEHVKSGGCWTAHYAIKQGKEGIWHVIEE